MHFTNIVTIVWLVVVLAGSIWLFPIIHNIRPHLSQSQSQAYMVASHSHTLEKAILKYSICDSLLACLFVASFIGEYMVDNSALSFLSTVTYSMKKPWIS